MIKITVTYAIECNDMKLTRSAEAEIQCSEIVSDDLSESLWRTAKKSIPKEKQEPSES